MAADPHRAEDAGAVRPDDESDSIGTAMGRMAGRTAKRTAYLLLFLLVFNNLVIPQLGGARRALEVISEVNPVLLVLAVVLELAAFGAYAQLTRVSLPRGTPVGRITLVRIQLATKAVTNLVPGGSAAGSTLGYRLLTAAGEEPSHATFALATAGIGSALVLNVLLWLGLLVSIPVDGFNPAYGTAAVVGLVVLGAFGGLVLLLSRGSERAERIIRAVARRLPFVEEDAAARLVRQIAGRLHALMADPPTLRRAVAWAVANWLLDAASLWVFLLAYGGTVNPLQLLVAFCLANVLAAIPITPGGLGVVEAVLTSTLVGFGVERGVAAVGVISYRLVAFWLPIPLGALAYTTLKVGPGRIRDRRGAIRVLTADTAADAHRHKWDAPDEPRG